MLKQVLFFGLMCCTFGAKAQLPKLKTDTSLFAYYGHSPLYDEFAGKYDLLIAHKHEGGWSPAEFHYSCIAFKGDKRYKITFGRMKPIGDKPEPKNEFKITPISTRIADTILAVFNGNDFWWLTRDSLNYDKYAYYHSETHRYASGRYYKSDGITDKFEIITKDGYAVIACYEPEFYFKVLPQIKQRGRFINAKRAFLALFPDVWQPPVDK